MTSPHGAGRRAAALGGPVALKAIVPGLLHKRDADAAAPETVLPDLKQSLAAADLVVPTGLDFSSYDFAAAGEPHRLDDYAVGEKIDHVDGVTFSDAEHMMATRLWQNTAKVHFNQHEQAQGQFKRRLIYGGVVISLARALSFNGLANAFHIAAVNGGRHVAPCFAGDTVYAWSEVLETAEIPGRSDIGALRARLTAVKNRNCTGFPLRNAKGDYDDGVILDLDLWVVLPR